MIVVVLMAHIWAAVILPTAVIAHRERQEAFLVSMGQVAPPDEQAPRRHSPRVERRRRIAGGLLVAMAVTFVVGLLPTFRVLLVVHLFLLNSFLGYVAMLAHLANRVARQREVGVEPVPARDPPARLRVPRPAVLAAG